MYQPAAVQPPLSAVSRSSYSTRQSTVHSSYGPQPSLPPPPPPAASDPTVDSAASSEADCALPVQLQSSSTGLPPVYLTESLAASCPPPPPPLPAAVAPQPDYEEVPPWNQPRSVDDMHFLYSMKCETTTWRILRVLALVLPAGLIVVGAVNLEACPLVPWLPHWNIVAGCLWFVHCGFYFLFRKSNEKNTMGYRFIKGIFLYLVLAAFVLGTALTYGTAVATKLSFVGHRENSCPALLFFSALGLVSAGHLLLAVFLWFYIFTFTFSFYEPELQQPAA